MNLSEFQWFNVRVMLRVANTLTLPKEEGRRVGEKMHVQHACRDHSQTLERVGLM